VRDVHPRYVIEAKHASCAVTGNINTKR